MGRGITRAVVALEDGTSPSDLVVYLAGSALISLSLLSPVRLRSLVPRFGHTFGRTWLIKPPQRY
jgi:hypothetical protein